MTTQTTRKRQQYNLTIRERLIHAPYLRDKIVQLALNDILSEYYNKTFIDTSYGSIKDKGTHRCVDKIQENLRLAYRRYGKDAYIVKIDMRKFFYSIDRDILKQIYRKKIKDKDILWVLEEIINSGDDLGEKGLPLGNTISQLSANVYLNELDQYAKRVLRLKYYTRYMDDIVIMVENKEKARETLRTLEKYTNKHLNLEFNQKKSQIFKITQGVNTVGFKIYTTHRLLRNDTKQKLKRKTKKFPRLHQEERITTDKINQILASWSGHANHGNSHNFKISILKRNPRIYMQGGVLKFR